MKRFFVTAIVAAFLLLQGASSYAQVSVNVNINSQPDWGPSGYDRALYYYLPDIDAYYYVPSKQFVYLQNGKWVWKSNLPEKYRGYDLYNSYKVVLNTEKAYKQHSSHVNQYGKYKGKGASQKVLRDSRGQNSNSSPSGNKPGNGKSNEQKPGNNSRPSGNNQQKPGSKNNNHSKR